MLHCGKDGRQITRGIIWTHCDDEALKQGAAQHATGSETARSAGPI